MEFIGNSWDKLHHAYIVVGGEGERVWMGLEEELAFRRAGNPDALHQEYPSLGIAEARVLTSWGVLKPVAGNRKVAVVSTRSITTEAQNALLKLFEDAPTGTHFFILLPSAGNILPTLLSRVRLVDVKAGKKNSDAEKFYKSSVAQRLSLAATISKMKDKQEARARTYELIEGLQYLTRDNIDQAAKVLQMSRYIGLRSSSFKMILEYLAISL